MAWVVPDKDRSLFEAAVQGTVINGKPLLRGIVDEPVKATVNKTGRCKGGRYYECRISYFGIDLGEEVFMMKDQASA